MQPFSPMLVYGLWNWQKKNPPISTFTPRPSPMPWYPPIAVDSCLRFAVKTWTEYSIYKTQLLGFSLTPSPDSTLTIICPSRPSSHTNFSSSRTKPSIHPRILQFSEQFSTPPAKDCKAAFSVAAPTLQNSLCSRFCNIGHFHRINQNVLICCIITIIKHINHLRDKLLVSQKYYQGVRKQFLLLCSSVLGSNIELSLSVFPIGFEHFSVILKHW